MKCSWPMLVIAGVLMLVVATGCIVAADKVDIAGKYKCEGVNPEGEAYKGTVEISKVGDSYKLVWTTEGEAETTEGLGILEGDVLGVGFPGGVVVYKVEKVEKGKLTGKWTLDDAKGKHFTETLTKQ